MQTSNLEIVNVVSKAISTIIWDHSNGRMMIKFKDSPVYLYPSATRALFDQFVKSPSKGQFFKTQIENQHRDFICLNN